MDLPFHLIQYWKIEKLDSHSILKWNLFKDPLLLSLLTYFYAIALLYVIQTVL